MARRQTETGRVSPLAVIVGSIAAGVLWQPVLLDPKPAWYTFSALRYLNYLLFFLPFVVVFLMCRNAGGKGWLRGGLMTGFGYLLTLPYTAIVQNAKMGSSSGFVMYHWGSWFFASFGLLTIFLVFFGLGALVGFLGARTGKTSRQAPLREEPAAQAVPGPGVSAEPQATHTQE